MKIRRTKTDQGIPGDDWDDGSTISFLSIDHDDALRPCDDDERVTSGEVSELRSQVRLLLKTVEAQKEEQSQLKETIRTLQKGHRSWFVRLAENPAVRATFETLTIPTVVSWFIMLAGAIVLDIYGNDIFMSVAMVSINFIVRIGFYTLWNDLIESEEGEASKSAQKKTKKIPVDYILVTLFLILKPSISRFLLWVSTISMAQPMGVIAFESINDLQDENESQKQSDQNGNSDKAIDCGSRWSTKLLYLHELYDEYFNQRLGSFYSYLWNSPSLRSLFVASRILYRLYCVLWLRRIHWGNPFLILDILIIWDFLEKCFQTRPNRRRRNERKSKVECQTTHKKTD